MKVFVKITQDHKSGSAAPGEPHSGTGRWAALSSDFPAYEPSIGSLVNISKTDFRALHLRGYKSGRSIIPPSK